MSEVAKKRKYKTRFPIFIVSIILQALIIASIVHAGALTSVSSFGSNPGNLKMYRYVPDNMPDEKAPLVVSLHGCKQSASIYATNGWKNMAEKLKFYVLFPEQSKANNPNHCFNWFDSGDTRRGFGEAQSIITMIDKMKSEYPIDEKRVFIEGLSAGGYMTSIMLAAYPDVFAGGAINAGGPAYCASSMIDAFSCMNPGKDKTPRQWGDLVRTQGYRGYTGPWPIVSIWHGTNDYTVNNTNQRELVDQWTNIHGIDQVVDNEDPVKGYPHKEYHDAAHKVRVETYSIEGMGHATAVDPDFYEANGCGKTSDYIADKDICSVYYIARFWGLTPKTPTEIHCKEWVDTLADHESDGRAYSKRSWWWIWMRKTYYAKGTDIRLEGSSRSTVTLHAKADEPGRFYLGQCD